MSAPASEFTGSIPENYDRYLGPLLFEPFAQDLVARLVEPLLMPRVLEVACGSGIVTRHLRERLARGVALVATDLNEAMLGVARRRLGEAAGIEWRQADAQALPFPDATFGAWVCQFGWMFLPDKAKAAREAFRVLSSGGQVLLNVWDSQRENPLGRIAHETLAALFPSDPPDFYRVPFGFHDSAAIVAFLHDAGFVEPRVATVALQGHSPSPEDAAIGLVRGNPVLAEIQARGARAEAVVDAVAAALRARFGAGPIRPPMRAHVIAARRP